MRKRNPYGAVVTPVCNTTTFQAASAAELEQWFRWLLHLDVLLDEDDMPCIYSRFDTPTHQSLYRALVEMEPGATNAAAFPSGMSAIYTTVKALTQQGDTILYTTPVYGCTDDFFRHYCPRDGVNAVAVDTTDLEAVEAALLGHHDTLRVIFIETPNNPLIRHSNIRKIAELAAKYPGPKGPALIVVDNTFLGPTFQHPFKHGANIVVYSATKFLGGHSSLLGGVALTNAPALMRTIRSFQSTSGPVFTPDACAELEKSIQFVHSRMVDEAAAATHIARVLRQHDCVEDVFYNDVLIGEQAEIYAAQCTGFGSVISFRIKGGRAEAFAFVDKLEVIYGNAVSLGGSHSLAIVPASSTHLGVPEEVRLAGGVTPNLIRISIGKEPVPLLEQDIRNALA